MTDIFLYGTLIYPPLFALLTGPGDSWMRTRDAQLADQVVERVAGSGLPMLRSQAGGIAQGRLVSGLGAAQRARLDLYQLAFGYHLAEVTVSTPDGPRPAQIYRPPPDQVSSGAPWSLAEWQAAAGPATLMAAGELAATDPLPSAAALLRQWPMIRSRADAALRASQASGPATLRHAARPQDFAWRNARPLQGAFFRLAALSVAHRRFDAAWSAPLPREVLVGTDAALVLPYDPARDRVLLVEQFRPGPARRGDPNPWCLEPVAGIVDADETPEAAAVRECAEEAGIAPRALERMFALYPSPGSTTDHVYCYLGLADLPDTLGLTGGLADEAEDLRLHLMSLEAALGLIDTGEVNVGPLVAMLFWLARHRDRLRTGPDTGLDTGH